MDFNFLGSKKLSKVEKKIFFDLEILPSFD